jgi:CHAT domain-containing protein
MAMDGTIRSRALVLDEIAARSVASSGSVDGADSVHARLMSAQQRLANLTVRGPGQMSDAQFKSLVDATRQEAETAEQELAAQSAEFRAERSRAETGLDDVVRALPLNSALVSIVHYNRTSFRAREAGLPASAPRRAAPPVPSYLAIVVRPGQAPAAVAIGSIARIDALIEQWRADIASEVLSTAAAVEGRASDDSRASGVALRQAVWDPLARYLGNANLVFVVPDGAFSMVPLAALPVGARSYLLEAGPVIHYLSAERDLLQRDELRADRGLLAIGGASFDGRIPPPAETAMTLRGGTAGCTDFRSISFPQLAGTAREVKDISSVWNAQTGAESGMARLLLGREAGETTFKREAHGYRVVHLATHGFFLDNSCAPAPSGTRGVGGLARTGSRAVENPLLLSGLALAGANRRARARADDDDGILTAEEVSMLDLHGTEWTVLSACDTGVGEIKAGEGVFGLRRAFQVAGARTVIMSLWSVEDQSTRAWMRALYEGRFQRHLSTADAVHQASLSVLRDRRARGLSTHPFFWAAFVAAGDWR